MNKNALYYLALFCSSLLLSAPLSAIEDDDPDLGAFIEGPSWEEEEVILPPFPKRDDLLKLEVDRVDMPFSFYIDPASLNVGKDGVSRYTIVIESNSGASNVMHEGIRCTTQEYRTYAYGTHDGQFSKAQTSNWTRISSSDAMAHRYNLKAYYLCSGIDRPLSTSESLRRMRYPENFGSGGERSDW
ncbi:CNP1-like family protein [Sulfuriflexus sp.]|uniref:CNP1-like family protein n=1 Tax=Sulfuriflexus sp. TaxID=2015443 RepID=UPI0028CC1836|nr:CNP1-like family protein [Sulfuriflexus sp.]MDT8403267.1 CNP1-like family protein [Sulfuriflexus sp.]